MNRKILILLGAITAGILTAGSLSYASYLGNLGAGYVLSSSTQNSYTVVSSSTLYSTLTGTSTALGTNAFNSTAYLPLAGGTLSGNMTSSASIILTNQTSSNASLSTAINGAITSASNIGTYWDALAVNETVASGTWELRGATYNAQTDFDSGLVGATGYLLYNSSAANNDEIDFGNLTLNAGHYLIQLSGSSYADRGILQVLLGSTSLGTKDYYGGSAYNVTSSFAFNPTSVATGTLKVKVNGKNGSSSGYTISFGRLEIIRTY